MKFVLYTFFGFILVREIPALIKKKYIRELVAFSVFMTVAIIIVTLQLFGVKIPSPISQLKDLMENGLHVHYSGFK